MVIVRSKWATHAFNILVKKFSLRHSELEQTRVHSLGVQYAYLAAERREIILVLLSIAKHRLKTTFNSSKLDSAYGLSFEKRRTHSPLYRMASELV